MMMCRVIAITLAGVCLAGCSSFASLWSSSPAPPPPQRSSAPSTGMFDPPALVVQLQIDSVPQGAEARMSQGPSCRTPCEIPLNDPLVGFSVTYTLNGFLPVTVPVQVNRVASSFWSWGGAVVDPNPVVVELQPVPPPPPPPRKMRPKRPAPPRTAAAPAPSASPFPAPTR
jgi:hypothetical protein